MVCRWKGFALKGDDCGGVVVRWSWTRSVWPPLLSGRRYGWESLLVMREQGRLVGYGRLGLRLHEVMTEILDLSSESGPCRALRYPVPL